MASVLVVMITMVVGLLIGIGVGFLFRPMLDAYLLSRMAMDDESPRANRAEFGEHGAHRA